ncbi:hypothetical protein [Streptomyces sp. NPDC058657]|uniref:hypothetical protein n=1 Tax=unclassified Streptomyces TaxID=2593676 RepID=UPI003646B3F2
MSDEPSNGELWRLIARLDNRFGELNTRLDKVVSLDVYTVQNGYVAQRLEQHQADIQRSTDTTAALEDAFEAYQRDEAKRRDDERQRRLYQAIVPVLMGLLSVAVAVWAVVAR